jgi:hypothetical protein
MLLEPFPAGEGGRHSLSAPQEWLWKAREFVITGSWPEKATPPRRIEGDKENKPLFAAPSFWGARRKADLAEQAAAGTGAGTGAGTEGGAAAGQPSPAPGNAARAGGAAAEGGKKSGGELR